MPAKIVLFVLILTTPLIVAIVWIVVRSRAIHSMGAPINIAKQAVIISTLELYITFNKMSRGDFF
nr:MAG TPA: hypothetical protein [Caudoviricetes sp.]